MSLSATDIHLSLGRKEILHGISMTAQPGQVTAIVGPNGSGKSTFLKALIGDLPYTGTVTLNGRPLGEFRPWELATRRAVLAQATTVAFPFTVREIVQLGQSAGLGAGDPGLVQRMLDLVDLAGFVDRPYHELSGGEQQRVQLARALAQIWESDSDTPAWLILDEPVSSLDIGHQYVVMDLMRHFAQRGGGVVAVMHDLNLTAMSADHVLLLQSGRVLGDGTPAEVLTEDLMSRAYGCPVRVGAPAPVGMPFVLPQARATGA